MTSKTRILVGFEGLPLDDLHPLFPIVLWNMYHMTDNELLASWFSKPCDGMPSNILTIPRHLKKRGGSCQSIDLTTLGRTSASTTTKVLRGLQPTYFGNCGLLSESSNNSIFKKHCTQSFFLKL